MTETAGAILVVDDARLNRTIPRSEDLMRLVGEGMFIVRNLDHGLSDLSRTGGGEPGARDR